jgi:copper transport protein
MDASRSPRRRVRLLLVVAAALAIAGGGASRASAANELESATPAPDSELTAAPSVLQLVFRDSLGTDVTAEQVRVAMVCNGTTVALGPRELAPDGRTFSAPLTQIAPPGTCSVSWVLPDTSSGSYSFKLLETTSTVVGEGDGDGSSDGPTSTPVAGLSDGTEDTNRLDGPLGLARLVAYLGLAALAGGLVVIAVAWPEGVEYGLTTRYLRVAWLVALAGTLATVVILTAQANDLSITAALSPAKWAELFDSAPGAAALVRLALVVAAGWVAVRPERVIDPATHVGALAIPLIAVASLGVARSGGDLVLVRDAVGALHALGMAMWLGGLFLVGQVVLAGGGEEDLVHAVRGYERLATPSLLVTIVTGVVLAWNLDAGDLFGSSHGWLVVLKSLLVALAVALAVMTKQFVGQRLSRADHLDARVAHRLRRAVAYEAACGVAVLAVTAWMMSTVPPGLEVGPSVDTAFENTIGDEAFSVTIGIDPAEVGPNTLVVQLLTPEEVTNLVVQFTPADATGVPGWEVNVPLTAPGIAVAPPESGFTLPASGAWNIEVTADGAEGRLPTLRSTLAVPELSGATTTVDSSATTTPATSATTVATTAPPATTPGATTVTTSG